MKSLNQETNYKPFLPPTFSFSSSSTCFLHLKLSNWLPSFFSTWLGKSAKRGWMSRRHCYLNIWMSVSLPAAEEDGKHFEPIFSLRILTTSTTFNTHSCMRVLCISAHAHAQTHGPVNTTWWRRALALGTANTQEWLRKVITAAQWQMIMN